MKSLVVQWASAWCNEAKTWQLIVTWWEIVLNKIPIRDSFHAVLDPPRVIFFGPPESDPLGASFGKGEQSGGNCDEPPASNLGDVVDSEDASGDLFVVLSQSF